jgi:hypothetical protein
MQSSFTKRLRRDDAETIAIRLLGFLGGNPEQLSRFLALTGMDLADLRAEAGNPQFLASLLDHVMADEALLLAFCANEGLDPALIAPALQLLAGEAC